MWSIRRSNVWRRASIRRCWKCKEMTTTFRIRKRLGTWRTANWDRFTTRSKRKGRFNFCTTGLSFLNSIFHTNAPIINRYLFVSNRFARESRPYQPPEDLKERFDGICMELFGEPANEKVLQIELKDPVIKYKVGKPVLNEHSKSKSTKISN